MGGVKRETVHEQLQRRTEMGKVTCDISMSLDGFIAGPNVRVGNGMGDDWDRLHAWVFGGNTETDDAIVAEKNASPGAILIGKRMFDVGFEPWGDPPLFGKPVFIVTHEAREPLPMQGGTTYTFVTEGIEAALELAREAAGDKDVGIWGGANIIQEYLKAGLLDEMQIHVIPVLFGDGTRLFEDLGGRRIELKRTSTIDTPGATRLRFSVQT
jgi:dihydrofolate reductase